jgi:hypothetical protein
VATPKPTKTKRSRRSAFMVAAGASVLLAIAGGAFADNLQNDAATTAGITTISAGGSTTITYRLIGNSAPNGDPNGCDATPATPVTVTITAPAGVTAPASVTFTACGNPGAQPATFTSNTAGSYPITHAISGGVAGSLFNNQANFTLTVNAVTPPNQAPSLSLPADITKEATSASGAVVSYTATASDAEDGPLTPTCSPASGSTFPLGITQVNCAVTDSALVTTTGMFNVTVVDTTAPTLTLPADITAEATGPSGAAVTYSASATDTVDGAVTPSCSPASGGTFALGATPVNCSATDAHGNAVQGSFTVTVVDTTPPVLTLPGDITATATSASGAAVSYTASASDLVDGSVTPSCSPASGSTFPVGSTTVNCSATDAAGNTATGSFKVSVQYAFHGFFQPVDNNGVYNVVKAGSSIPVKFDLSGDMGLAIFAAGSPQSAKIPCSATSPQDSIEETATAGASGLKYDPAANPPFGQYSYVWKTDKAWAATCRQLQVKLADGTTRTANFNFTR